MSDIHGKYDEYMAMLKQIGFDKFSRGDKLFILGDVIDRSSGGIQIMQHIMKNTDKIELLMGNHEKMMLDSLNDNNAMGLWMYNGGYETLREYEKLSTLEQDQMRNFIASLKYSKTIQIGTKIYELVHASPLMSEEEIRINMVHFPNWAINMDAKELMLWLPMEHRYILGNKVVVFGHRCTKYYQRSKPYGIYKSRYMIGIDCGCAYKDGNGRLGCLRLDDKKEFYIGFSIM